MTGRRILELVVAVAAIVAGILVTLNPFPAVRWLGVALAVGLIAVGIHEFSRGRERATAVPLGAVFTAAGIVLLTQPSWTPSAIVWVTAAVLVVATVTQWMTAMSTHGTARWTALLLSIATFALLLVATAWPGVTTFLATFCVGIGLIWFGLMHLWHAVSGPRDRLHEGTGHRRLGLVAAAITALVTVPMAVFSITDHAPAPAVASFYSSVPLDPNAAPGTLLKAEPFGKEIPDDARGWRILYTTTRDDGVPALASGLVVAPKDAPAGPRPVIAWAHGTTGYAEGCAPSNQDEPFSAGAAPALNQVIDNGWVMVATDYVGMGTAGPSPYVIGQGEGRSVLDAVRAAHRMTELDLSGQTVVWGHSQGGHAALWTAHLAPTYAPDTDVTGVAALAPASDLSALAQGLEANNAGSLFGSYVVQAYADNYPDVDFDRYIKPAARETLHEMSKRCLTSPSLLMSVLGAVFLKNEFYAQSPDSGPLGERLKQNTMRSKLDMPLLLGQGLSDQVIDPESQKAYAGQQCELGTDREFHTYEGLDHVGVVGDGSPAVDRLLTWTQDRIDGKPSTPNC